MNLLNLSQENKTLLVNSGKTLLWQMGAFGVVGALSFLSANLGMFDVPADLRVVLSLLLACITKMISKKYQLGQKHIG